MAFHWHVCHHDFAPRSARDWLSSVYLVCAIRDTARNMPQVFRLCVELMYSLTCFRPPLITSFPFIRTAYVLTAKPGSYLYLLVNPKYSIASKKFVGSGGHSADSFSSPVVQPGTSEGAMLLSPAETSYISFR
jgi:hypothetical protein